MRTPGLLIGCATLLLGSSLATADVPPPPGYLEQYSGELIRAAGHECPRVVSLYSDNSAAAEELRRQGLEVRRAQCSNGKAYLVGTPRRRYGPPRPDDPPPPKPVVKPV